MQDLYQRPPEEQNIALETQLKKAYPDLVFHEFRFVDRPTHYVIDDISPYFPHLSITAEVHAVEELTSGRLRVLSPTSLCRSLGVIISPLLETVDLKRTAIIFPGEGAKTVKTIIDSQGMIDSFYSAVIGANRLRGLETGVTHGVRLSVIEKAFEEVVLRNIETIIVFDDVIDTGGTIRTVRKEMAYPNTRWFAATPVIVSPLIYKERENFPSSVEGYEKIFAALVIQDTKTPSINSLSSFLESGQKAERLIRQCLEYSRVEDRDRFFEAILRLQNMFGYS